MFNDRPFKFYMQLKREECKSFIYTMAHNWAISGRDPVSHSHWIYVCSLYMSMFTLAAI